MKDTKIDLKNWMLKNDIRKKSAVSLHSKASVLDLTHDCSIGMNNAYLVMLTSAAACCQRMADNLS